MKINRIIQNLTPFLVFSLSVGTFVLSFDGLSKFAAANEVNARLTWVWALSVDFTILISALSLLRAQLNKEDVRFPRFMVLLGTGLSVLFNALHVSPDFLARASAALPPSFLALSFELFLSQIKADVKRSTALDSLADIRTQFEDMKRTFEDTKKTLEDTKRTLEDQLAKQRAQLQTLTDELKTKRKEKQEALDALDRELVTKRTQLAQLSENAEFLKTGLDPLALRRDTALIMFEAGRTVEEIAELWQVNPRTIKRDLNGALKA